MCQTGPPRLPLFVLVDFPLSTPGGKPTSLRISLTTRSPGWTLSEAITQVDHTAFHRSETYNVWHRALPQQTIQRKAEKTTSLSWRVFHKFPVAHFHTVNRTHQASAGLSDEMPPTNVFFQQNDPSLLSLPTRFQTVVECFNLEA